MTPEQMQEQDHQHHQKLAAANMSTIQRLEKTIDSLRVRNTSLLESVHIIRGSIGHKCNRPQRTSQGGRARGSSGRGGSKSKEDETRKQLKFEIQYSTSLEEEVNARGEQVRLLNSKCKQYEQNHHQDRQIYASRNKQCDHLILQVQSLKDRERLLQIQISKYRRKLKSDVSVEKKMSNACIAMSTFYDRQVAKSSSEVIGTNDSALKAGIGGLSKFVLNLEKRIESRETTIVELNKKQRSLYETIDLQTTKIQTAEYGEKTAAAELTAMKLSLGQNSSIISTASTTSNALDGGGSSILFATAPALATVAIVAVDVAATTTAVDDVDDAAAAAAADDNDDITADATADANQWKYTNEWKDAATVMFQLLDLDQDGFVSKSELMRATTLMHQHHNGSIQNALDQLPILRSKLTPKSYLLTISDMFPTGTNKITLEHYLHYLGMMMKTMNVTEGVITSGIVENVTKNFEM